MVGRSGCGLGINVKRVRAGTNAVKKSGYFPACNVAVILKSRQDQDSCSSARETNKSKKATSEQKQGLNFSVMLTFGFATTISVKNLKAIKRDLYCFSMTLKTVIFFSCPNSKGNILQKALTFLGDNWKSQFEGLFA